MPELDPFAAALPERPVLSRTFTDPGQPGRELVLTLRPMDELDTYLAFDLRDKAVQRYITGPGSQGKEPDPFPLVGGRFVTLSETLFLNAAYLCVMQHPAEEKDRKGIEYFVGIIAAFKDAWDAIKAFMIEVNREGEDKDAETEGARKNASGEATD